MALKNNFHPIHDHFVMRNSLVTTAGFRLLIAAASAITITVLTMAVATIHPVLTPSTVARVKNRRGTGRHSTGCFIFSA